MFGGKAQTVPTRHYISLTLSSPCACFYVRAVTLAKALAISWGNQMFRCVMCCRADCGIVMYSSLAMGG